MHIMSNNRRKCLRHELLTVLQAIYGTAAEIQFRPIARPPSSCPSAAACRETLSLPPPSVPWSQALVQIAQSAIVGFVLWLLVLGQNI